MTSEPEFHGTIDLRSSVLDEAGAFAKRKESAFAVVFYATWFEHWINNLLTLRNRRLTLSQVELVLYANIEVKFLAFPAMLDFPPIAPKHVRCIASIAAARNKFVHYKYQTHDLNKSDPLQGRWDSELRRAEPTVRYLVRYEREHIYRKAKGRVRRLFSPTKRQ